MKIKNLMLGGLFVLSMLTSVFSIASADDGDLLWSHDYNLTYDSVESDISCYDSRRNNICPTNIDAWSEYTLCIDVDVVPSSSTTAFYQSPGYWSSFYSDVDTLYTNESTCRTLRPGSVDTEGGSNELPIYWNIRPNCGEGGMGDDCGAVEGIVSYRLYEGVYEPPIGGDDTGDGENSLFGFISNVLGNYTDSIVGWIPYILLMLLFVLSVVEIFKIIRRYTLNIFTGEIRDPNKAYKAWKEDFVENKSTSIFNDGYKLSNGKVVDDSADNVYRNSKSDVMMGYGTDKTTEDEYYLAFMNLEYEAGISRKEARKNRESDRAEGISYKDSVERAYYDRKYSNQY